MGTERSRIDNKMRDLFLYRILCDELWYNGRKKLLIKSPSPRVLLRSEIVYNEVYDECKDEEIYTHDDVVDMMFHDNIWTDEDDHEFELLPDKIKNFKVNLFQYIKRPMVQNHIRLQLKEAKKHYDRLFHKKHKFDYLTLEGVSNFAKFQYIISKCTFYKGKRWNWSSESMYSVLDFYYKNIISDDVIRNICKSNSWGHIWANRKDCAGLFDKSAYELTPDQSRLIYWSKLYESVYEQEDCSPKLLLEDNDLFDGWLLYKEQERKSEHAERFIKNPKIANSREIFVNANNPQMGSVREQAREILDLNSPRSRNIIKNRYARLDKEGVVRQQDFRDVQESRYER